MPVISFLVIMNKQTVTRRSRLHMGPSARKGPTGGAGRARRLPLDGGMTERTGRFEGAVETGRTFCLKPELRKCEA